MKNHFKYSILLMLALMITISLVNAQPVKIGQSEQNVPCESSPTATAKSGVGTPTDETRMYDGSLSLFGYLTMGTGLVSSGSMEFKTFKVPADPKPFDPGWVDIKISYKVESALTDDTFKIQYTVGAAGAWKDLAYFDAANSTVNPGFIHPFAQVAEPTDNVWTWADVTSLRVRFLFSRVSSWDVRVLDIFEVWASVYPLPLPDSASTAVSLQPSDVSALTYFFVDVYAMGCSWWDPEAEVTRGLWGYQFTLSYDTNVLTALEFFSYYPFKTAAPSGIDDLVGTVSVAYATYAGDPKGFIGNTPLARVYFKTDSTGASDLRLTLAELKPAVLSAVYPPTHDCKFWGKGILSAVDGISTLVPITLPPGSPVGTYWHELYPAYSHTYTVSDWTDTNADGNLNPSDDIEVVDDVGNTRWFHVDVVTTTIHFTLTDLEIEEKCEPLTPTTEPMGDPRGTRWHTIYDTGALIAYCEMFTIDGWTDTTGNGKFDPSDTFTVTYDNPDLAGPYAAHLDAVSTDIIVTEKLPEIPEFPLGIGVLMAIAPLIPIVYIWRLRKKSR